MAELYSHCSDLDLNGQKTSRYTHLRPYETRNLLFSGMIFHSSQVVLRIENLGEKYQLVPSSCVLGTNGGSKSVFNPNLLKMLVIFRKMKSSVFSWKQLTQSFQQILILIEIATRGCMAKKFPKMMHFEPVLPTFVKRGAPQI